MKFNASNNVDFTQWTQARLVRENNEKILKNYMQDDMPKFGEGSQFGKDMKEEARRKKLGINMKKYNPDAQPWLMRVGGKGGRKYKGIREGGVSNNTTYYVFTHGKDGAFEAFPIVDWYNFTPMMRYKTLDADEAEEKFAQRGKVLNKWAVMVRKKLKPGQEDDEELDGEEGAKKKGKKGDKEGKDFKISDMDDWDGSDDGLDTDDEDKKKEKDDDSDDGKKKRSKDSKKKGKKKKNSDDEEAFEDSSEDDNQTKEVDYMSDESSDSDEDVAKDHDVKGVDQDEGLSKMLDSESSSSDEDKNKDKDDDDDEDETGKKKKKKGGSRANSDDEGKKKKGGSANSSRSGTPTKDLEKASNAEKRKAMVANILDPVNEPSGKKSRLEQFGSAGASGSIAGNEAISEEAVRRYLKRRPMTTTDLLKKFRSKKTGIQNAQLVQLLANILKKINPHKQKTKGVTYLSLKEGM